MDKLEFLKIARDWYLGMESISDFEFDTYEEELRKKYPDWDYRDHLDLQGVDHLHYIPMEKIPKVKDKSITPTSLISKYGGTLDYLPKYDGCGVCLYYKDGKLHDVLTRSNQVSGKRQYDKFKSMVPTDLPNKDIVAIECEAVIDLKHGWDQKSRSKANGLVNSNSMQEECEKLLTLVAFKVRFKDNRSEFINELIDLPTIRYKDNVTFLPSPVSSGSFVKNVFTGMNKNRDTIQALCDGIVLIKDPDFNGVDRAYKLYANDMKTSTITNIEWNLHPESLKYVPKYRYTPVELDGTICKAASATGLKTLRRDRCGVGSTVQVQKSGVTIPKVIPIKGQESDVFNLPIICGCNTLISEKDELNDGLYCPNEKCHVIKDKLTQKLNESKYSSFEEFLRRDPLRFIREVVKVPRFNADQLDTSEDLYDFDLMQTSVHEVVTSLCHLTELQLKVLTIFTKRFINNGLK